MAIAISRKDIYCPNCQYEGKSKIKGATGAEWGIFLLLIIVSVFIPIFWLATAIMLLWLIFKPARHVCPECKFENTAPGKSALRNVEHTEKNVDSDSKICPSCAETIKAEAKKCRFCGENFSDEAL